LLVQEFELLLVPLFLRELLEGPLLFVEEERLEVDLGYFEVLNLLAKRLDTNASGNELRGLTLNYGDNLVLDGEDLGVEALHCSLETLVLLDLQQLLVSEWRVLLRKRAGEQLHALHQTALVQELLHPMPLLSPLSRLFSCALGGQIHY